MLETEGVKHSAPIDVRQASGSSKARIYRHEVYSEDVRRCLLPAGRMKRMLNVFFVWEDTPYLYVRRQ
eukprot:5613268-Amphidinium_carterae.1